MKWQTTLLLCLAGCDGAALSGTPAAADTTGASDTTTPETLTPSAWRFDDDGAVPAPALTPDELAVAVARATDAIAGMDPWAMRDLYDTIIPYDVVVAPDPEGCPYVIDYDDFAYWTGSCTAASGITYIGYGVVQRVRDPYSFYRTLVGRVEAPDGTWLEGAGNLYGQRYLGEELYELQPFSAGGPRAPADKWLDGLRAYDLADQVAYKDGGAMVHFEGSLRAPDLLPAGIDAVALEQLTFMNAPAGAYCDIEPGGAVAVRTSAGEWYEIRFDGRTRDEEEKELALCDGCGATTFRGATLAPTCLDPQPWFTPR